MRNTVILLGLASALILSACHKKEQPAPAEPAAPPAMEAPPAEMAPPAETPPAEAPPAQ